MMIYDLEMVLYAPFFHVRIPFMSQRRRQTNATVQTICYVAEPFSVT